MPAVTYDNGAMLCTEIHAISSHISGVRITTKAGFSVGFRVEIGDPDRVGYKSYP